MAYVEVAVNSPFPTFQTFSYLVPQGMDVRPGDVVYVPFGPRILQSVVMEVTEQPSYPEVKAVQGVVWGISLLPHQLALARWLSRFYLAPLFSCLSLMMPPGSQQRPLTYYVALAKEDFPPLTLNQRRLWEFVQARGRVEVRELTRALRMKGTTSIAASLVRKGLLARSLELSRPKGRPRIVTYIVLSTPPPISQVIGPQLEKARRLQGLLDYLKEGGRIPLTEARSRWGVTRRQLAPLIGKGILTLEEVPQPRDPLWRLEVEPSKPPQLTAHQQKAVEAIVGALRSGEHQTFLVHGVTGSGKTEVYLAAIKEALEMGKRALVLVPEISLTPQTVRRFASRFPGQVTIFHSGLTLGEQYDVWQTVRKGERGIVIGTRSALFLPIAHLGLIIMDEEHEWAYKQQDPPPRYHARRVAEELSRITGAVLVLGSATPSIESYHKARQGHYTLLELPHRLRPAENGTVILSPLPEVEVIDMRQELQKGNTSIFSQRLQDAMQAALQAGEQVILFLNRRGSAAALQCQACGQAVVCSGCRVPYTVHQLEERLVCHYCSRTRRIPQSCPTCGNGPLRAIGIGTQRVEEEVKRLFTGVSTLRWDRDVTRHWGDHLRILEAFMRKEAQVLVGTQMLAKGLDLPWVTVTGIVMADIGIHAPDFRSAERGYQVLEQVAGRAGRGPRGGRVIVQTYNPAHPALQALVKHDYNALYLKEISVRQPLLYPPFGELARLTIAHPDQHQAKAQAAALVSRLRRLALSRPIYVLGPIPAYPLRLRGRYRWHVLIKGEEVTSILGRIELSAWWSVDVDPLS